jgi:hypothetical protein
MWFPAARSGRKSSMANFFNKWCIWDRALPTATGALNFWNPLL